VGQFPEVLVSDDLSIPSPTYRIPRHRQGMDPVTRRLALIAGGLGATLVLVVGGSSLFGHSGRTVPVVQADSRPIRVKPENPGGLQVAGANEDILSGNTASDEGRLAPPPEAPAPQAMLTPAPEPPVATAPVPTLAPTPAPMATPAPEPPKPVAAKSSAPPEKHPAPPPAVRSTLVQLAAVRSEEAAKSEWERLSKRLPDLLGQHKPAFSRTEHDGHALWRVRTGGFADVAQATTFCERLRAKGVNCAVADF
jgi:hypothetical protein